MRIVHVNPFFFPYFGGIERRIYHLSRGLAQRGHELTVVTARLPGTAAKERLAEGFDVVRVPARILVKNWNPPLLRPKGTAAALAELDPDVIDYHSRWAPEMTNAVAGAGKPWVFTFHNHFGEGSRWLRPLSLANDRWALRKIRTADAIACVSPAIRDELQGLGLPPESLHVLGNGCDPPREGAADWQADDGRPLPTDPYFITVGRLTPEKGVLQALEAFAQAAPTMPRARLVMCGTGPLQDRLLQRARQRGVADRVQLEGWVPEATKFRFLAGAQAMVNLAPFEAYGIAVAEAIVAGTPAIVADVGGAAAVAGAGGLPVPANDVAAAAHAMQRVWDAGERARLAAGARSRAPELAWSRAVMDMEALYKRVAASRGA